MRKVDLKTLKRELSKYLRLAAAGETIAVTDHHRVVAEIVPPRAPVAPLEVLLRELAADRAER